MALLLLFEIYRIALRALVVLMGVHFLLGTIQFLRFRRRPEPPPDPPREWPRVTVQLPIRDEYYTARRVVETAAALDYPLDRLQIQVLDDSTDKTTDLLLPLIAELREKGVDIVHLRRFAPIGFKAGALHDGLLSATGEFIAIFDADFLVPRDFLKRTIVHFADPKVGMVQGRWAHLNRNHSWFTRLQAQILDGLMIVEQTAKSRTGLPLQFNGTAGVWRRKAIEEAGGWTFDSLTEDLDLSMRAQFLGYQLVHLPDVAAPAELPTSLGLFRVQQRRWALGTAQLLRKRFTEVLRSSLPLGSRISLLMQLGRHFSHPLLMIMVFTVPLTTFAMVDTLIEYDYMNAAVFAIALGGVAFQHATAARAIGRSAVEAILLSPLVIALAIGLAPTYTIALAYGLRDRAGAFHRTPKVTRHPEAGEPKYRAKRSVLVLAETAIGMAYAYFTTLAVDRGFYVNAGFLALIAFSFCWMGVGSLRVVPQGRAQPANTKPHPAKVVLGESKAATPSDARPAQPSVHSSSQ